MNGHWKKPLSRLKKEWSKNNMGVDKKKNKHGGRRKGAGRPAGWTKTAISLRIDNDLLEFVKTKPNRSKFINSCIRKEKDKDKG